MSNTLFAAKKRFAEFFDLEPLACVFSAELASRVPAPLRPLVFSSPVSARSPDVSRVWHPGYLRRNYGRVCRAMFGAVLSGAVKCFFGRRVWFRSKFAYSLPGGVSQTLLIVPSHCGKFGKGGLFTTPYAVSNPGDSFFVFGPAGACGPEETNAGGLSAAEKLRIVWILFFAGIAAVIRTAGGLRPAILLALLWMDWVFGCEWARFRTMGLLLERLARERGLKKIGCVHEMHAYARVVWDAAARAGVPGSTVQHATVAEGKRWYFASYEELKAGLRTPSVMYVFEERVADMLRPCLRNTEFRLGCSSRYAGWKAPREVSRPGRGILVVGALAWFDNDVLFEVLRRLPGVRGGRQVSVRFHPDAIVRPGDRLWLERAQAEGAVALSKGSLAQDISQAGVVIGMSTTVLEEAVLLGRPVIQIKDADFLKYIDLDGVSGARCLAVSDITSAAIESAGATAVDTAAMRERLGLNRPEVAYGTLFS